MRLALTCFALLPQARATCQEGCLANQNTALGDDALISLGFGVGNNTAVGFNALLSDFTGFDNTAVGSGALVNNVDGAANTAIGRLALASNSSGVANTATGNIALSGNTTGFGNTATGNRALLYSSSGNYNTATGSQSLDLNINGHHNTATGALALYSNLSGTKNTATGSFSLYANTGSRNIALGYRAGQALTGGNDNIEIGNAGVAGESGTIRIGTPGTHTATFIAGISGATIAGGVGVIIDNNGHLGTAVSSKRFKDAIKPMDKASEAILSLKPVTFRYKHELDPDGIPQFGLVAEDVEKVNPDLVARDEQGKPYTVRYEAVNAMLLNEFLKDHRTVQEQNRKIQAQDATIAQLKQNFGATIARQQKQIEALTAGLQKVSAQVELSKSVPQTVVNNR